MNLAFCTFGIFATLTTHWKANKQNVNFKGKNNIAMVATKCINLNNDGIWIQMCYTCLLCIIGGPSSFYYKTNNNTKKRIINK